MYLSGRMRWEGGQYFLSAGVWVPSCLFLLPGYQDVVQAGQKWYLPVNTMAFPMLEESRSTVTYEHLTLCFTASGNKTSTQRALQVWELSLQA